MRFRAAADPVLSEKINEQKNRHVSSLTRDRRQLPVGKQLVQQHTPGRSPKEKFSSEKRRRHRHACLWTNDAFAQLKSRHCSHMHENHARKSASRRTGQRTLEPGSETLILQALLCTFVLQKHGNVARCLLA